MLFIELRESQTATITFSSKLRFTPDYRERRPISERCWPLIGCYVTSLRE